MEGLLVRVTLKNLMKKVVVVVVKWVVKRRLLQFICWEVKVYQTNFVEGSFLKFGSRS